HVGFSADPNQPTGAIDCVPASCTNPSGPVTVHLSVTDPQSGIAETRYTTDGSDPTPTTGHGGDFVQVTAPNTTVKFWAVDNVGNAGGVASPPASRAQPPQHHSPRRV